MAYEKQFILNPGSLRNKISIQRVTIGKDEDNRPIEILTEIVKCKAKITGLKGSERTESQGNIAKIEKRLYIRKPSRIKIVETDIVIINEEKYNIVYINNIDERDKYYEIRVQLVK